MTSPYGIKTLIRRTFGQRFALARLSHHPIIGAVIDRLLFEGDDIMYLPRDNAIAVNQRLHPREDLAVPSQVLEHFIHQARYHWVMDFCICRDASHCQTYPIKMSVLSRRFAWRMDEPASARNAGAADGVYQHARHKRSNCGSTTKPSSKRQSVAFPMPSRLPDDLFYGGTTLKYMPCCRSAASARLKKARNWAACQRRPGSLPGWGPVAPTS